MSSYFRARRGVLWGRCRAILLLAFALATIPARPASGVRFFAIGDVPYSASELRVLKTFLAEEVKKGPPFVIHVGDIKGGSEPCTDARLQEIAALFRAQPVPVAYTPGDNEWTDCHRLVAGGYDPLERLGAVRRLFFGDPGVLKLNLLGAVHPESAFPEDYYFLYGGVMFAALHAVGSHNNRNRKDSAAMAEFRARAAANRRLIRKAIATANRAHATAVVLMFQADPGFGRSKPPRGFAPLWEDLGAVLKRFPGPVLAIHGDSHRYTFDHPLKDAATGAVETRFTRLEVPGSPTVGGVWVTVEPGAARPFGVNPVYPDARALFMGE
jgi:hypothetical protein